VPVFDRLERFVRIAGAGCHQQLLQHVGDLGDRRVDHEDAVAGFETAVDDQRDVAPVRKRGDAGAAELDDNPAR
jgi:hypothetical protein